MNRRMIIGAILGVAGMLSLGADEPKVYKPDAEGFIRNWLVLDPIVLKDVDHSEEVEKPMFAKEYFKDQLTMQPKADAKVTVDGKEMQWREVKAEDYAIDFNQFSSDHNKDSDSVLYWGITYLTVPDETRDVKLAIGSDDSSVWWVNGKEVIRVYDGRAVNQDDNVSKPLTLQKGVNVIRFAVINGDGPSGACARLLDAGDKPIKNYTVSVVPPAAPATAPGIAPAK